MCYRFGGVYFWLFLLINTTNSQLFPRIRRMVVTSDIRYRFATTHISLDVGNTMFSTEDFYFEVQLPIGSLISDLSLYVNGTHYERKIEKVSPDYKIWLQKTKINLKPIKTDRTLFYDSSIFAMTVPMAGLSKGQFNLTYNYLIHRQNNIYKFPLYLFFRQGQYVEDIIINTYLWEQRKLIHQSMSLSKERNMPILEGEQKMKFNPTVERLSAHEIHISYNTSLGYVKNIFTRNFLLEYTLQKKSNLDGDVLWHNKQGLFFFAPHVRKPIPKDIVFTIDYTDSMKKEILAEVQKALKSMLKMTSSKDRFNIILFNSVVYRWKDNLQPVTINNIENALQFIKSVSSRGVSNFNLAIEESLTQLNSTSNKSRNKLVYFLTDGWHSIEYMKKHKIIKLFRKNNEKIEAKFFTVALHSKADYIIMKSLSNLSGGKLLRIVKPQNISESMINFYKEMNTPLLKNITMIGTHRNTKNYIGLKDYYKGSENILYFNKDNFKEVHSFWRQIKFTVSTIGANGPKNFTTVMSDVSTLSDNIGGLNSLQRKNFMSTYLDYLFIRMTIDRKLTSRREEAMERAKKSGFLTPWTYLSAIPSTYDLVQNPDSPQNILDDEIEIPGRGFTGSGVGDPHFTIGIRGLKRPVCFDLSGHDGDVINLLTDVTKKFHVNAKIIKAGKNSKKTYIGEIQIIKSSRKWVINPEKMKRQISTQLLWRDADNINQSTGNKNSYNDSNNTERIPNILEDISITHSDNRTLTVTTQNEKGKIEFLIRRTFTKHQPKKTRYLNIYLTDSSGLSYQTHGLMGQFINWKGSVTKLNLQPNGKIQSGIRLQKQRKIRTFKAILTHSRRSLFSHQQCWTVWKEGHDFIKGKYEDYLIRRPFSPPSLHSPHSFD
ncbi:inter-alpha-trypsin inhibitor heavy chain H5-like [Argonauta hians]